VVRFVTLYFLGNDTVIRTPCVFNKELSRGPRQGASVRRAVFGRGAKLEVPPLYKLLHSYIQILPTTFILTSRLPSPTFSVPETPLHTSVTVTDTEQKDERMVWHGAWHTATRRRQEVLSGSSTPRTETSRRNVYRWHWRSRLLDSAQTSPPRHLPFHIKPLIQQYQVIAQLKK